MYRKYGKIFQIKIVEFEGGHKEYLIWS